MSMSKEAAIAYGKKIGVCYYVKNNHGGLMGGTKTLADAEKMKSKWEREERLSPNPWATEPVTYHIEKIA